MPYRAVFAALALVLVVPAAFTQSATRLFVKAKCTFPDGSLIGTQLIEVSTTATAEEKRAAAEHACQPMIDEAYAACEDLANRVDALRSDWRIAAPHSYRIHQLEVQMKAAKATAPTYCK
jgi:hypothetical protein